MKRLARAVAFAARAMHDRIAPGAAILLYHRVTDLHCDPHLLAVSPANFEQHLAILRHAASPLPLKSLGTKRGNIAITFDDGYADNLENAAPLLARYGIPATVFVATGYCASGDEFWWDAESRGATTPGTRQTHRPLTAAQLRLFDETIDLGAHTVSHPRLATLTIEKQTEEIVNSKRDLEAMSGREVTTFAYPFGGIDDFSRDSVRIVRDAGFELACANVPGTVRRGTDRFALPRLLVRNWTAEEFRRRIGPLLR